MRYEKYALFGFGDLHEEVLRMVLRDALRKVFIGLVELGGLVYKVEETEWVELKQVYHWLVVLEPNIMRKFLKSLS
jgi:hypothetical protein